MEKFIELTPKSVKPIFGMDFHMTNQDIENNEVTVTLFHDEEDWKSHQRQKEESKRVFASLKQQIQ